jgi:cold shock CspA family protein
VESSTDDYLTGTVKFYLRDRLFGFIIPDDPLLAKTNELWCHRTSIKSDRSFEESPSRPYLRNKERVKFRIQAPTEEERDTPVAIDIVFENGRQVPLFRKK